LGQIGFQGADGVFAEVKDGSGERGVGALKAYLAQHGLPVRLPFSNADLLPSNF